MSENGHKWPKIEISGEWWENGVVIAWGSFLFVDFNATAPSVNIFVNKNGDGSSGSPQVGTNGEKWPKMAKN